MFGGGGHGCAGRGGHTGSPALGNQLESKIENLGLAARRDQDIGGLDVTVHDAAGVRCVQGVGHLDADIEQLLQLQAMPRQVTVQWLALD